MQYNIVGQEVRRLVLKLDKSEPPPSRIPSPKQEDIKLESIHSDGASGLSLPSEPEQEVDSEEEANLLTNLQSIISRKRLYISVGKGKLALSLSAYEWNRTFIEEWRDAIVEYALCLMEGQQPPREYFEARALITMSHDGLMKDVLLQV